MGIHWIIRNEIMSGNYNIALDYLLAFQVYGIGIYEIKHLFITRDEAMELAKSTSFSYADIEFIFSIK